MSDKIKLISKEKFECFMRDHRLLLSNYKSLKEEVCRMHEEIKLLKDGLENCCNNSGDAPFVNE